MSVQDLGTTLEVSAPATFHPPRRHLHLTFSPDTLRLYDAQSHAALGAREA
jgi:hypothetical protein